ncbi:MAG: DNA mismatch repair protein MutS [Microgenomates bacterium OLB22]|nr:MAG: DNA mismatch repair protein MutS [Microgenomates bacterium OLB22]
MPEHFLRKQTLVNAERFTTQELRELEETHIVADAKCQELEKRHYERLTQAVATESEHLLRLAGAIAELDCLVCFAEVAERRSYIRPRITSNRTLEIIRGRHPVVEALLESHEFVPNDTVMDPHEAPVQILTGPNMAGKSVYMRQVALIIILAQIGSYVPADQAMVGVVDKIFVRSGASDRITEKQSTFMVEMVETAYILRNCTPRSLIVLDEIGRGTSTYDGVSIAWAVASYLAQDTQSCPKTLFATHYHELQELAHLQKTVLNFQISVEEHHASLSFYIQLLRGKPLTAMALQLHSWRASQKRCYVGHEKNYYPLNNDFMKT